MTDTPDERTALTQELEGFLNCPTSEALSTLQVALVAYQTRWIKARAGVGLTPTPAATAVTAGAISLPAKPLPRVAFAERLVLQKLADGWQATTADVPRWNWFENRELIRLEPVPDGSGREFLVLTDLGRAVAST